jgi:probable F420-dependent oxidoreductase
MALRPFRFGVIAETFESAEQWTSLARRVETLGYDTLLVRDHFVLDVFGHQFAPFPALMAAAMATTTLRLGTLVVSNDVRHPVLLAKEAATLDLLSGGRLELGIGAGWQRVEYERAGMPFDRNGMRIDRLEEALAILDQCFAGGPVSYSGAHYRIDGVEPWPLPAPRPRPPLLIGAGAPRMLALAGRHADIVSILTTSVASGALVDDPALRRSRILDERIGYIRAGAGSRFDRIELSLIPEILLTDDRVGTAEALIERRRWPGISVEDVWDMPAVCIGTVDEVCAQLVERRGRFGLSYFVVSDARLEDVAPVVGRLRGR